MHFKSKVVVLLLILFNLIGYLQATITHHETGLFPILNYSTEDYNSLPQIWSIVQDKRNVIYAANRDGILQFDGKNWVKIKIGNELIGRSLCLSVDGLVYVGSYNEFGYLKTTHDGKTQFESLKHLLKNQDIEIGDIWKTFAVNEKIIFQSASYILIYTNNKVEVLTSEFGFINSFVVNSQFFVLDKNGLLRLQENELKLIENSAYLSQEKLYVLLPDNYNIWYGITNSGGAYKINYFEDKNLIRSFKQQTEVDKFILDNQLYTGVKVDGETYSVGTFNGIKVIDKKGNYLYNINKETGCIDENVKFQYLDNSGKLWLGLSNGISCVHVNSPITFFNDKHNINGTIESITRYDGKITIATSVGAYELLPELNSYKFKLIEGNGIPASETWITKTISIKNSNTLLLEQNEKIHQVNKNNSQLVYEGIPWAIYQSKYNENTFFFGVEDGVWVYECIENKWRARQKLDSITSRITDIIYDNTNNLWLSAETKGIYKLAKNDFNDVEFYATKKELPGGPYIFTEYKNNLLVGTAEGIYVYDATSDQFIIENNFASKFGQNYRYIHRLSVDHTDRLWAVTYINGENHEVGFFDYASDSSLFWNPIPFLGEIKGQINAIYHDTDGITWLGGNEGLFRYDANKTYNYQNRFNCLIRKVRLGEDSTYFYGNYFNEKGMPAVQQPELLKPLLDYEHNSLIFDYAAMNVDVDNPTRYSYFLEGYDKKWSEWSTETKKEYTNLHEGVYVFNVKAKNIYNHESTIGTFEFEISPPWYRTWWAYILFFLSAIGVVYLIVTQYTKYLRAVIRENTAEIRAQKDEIEKQKDEITASIKYAERIQRAVVPTAERAKELLPEHFIMWRPRDIVSGDFWWMAEKDGKVAIIAADCTGHGVPGAFMSMLGIAFLNEIVAQNGITQANLILNELRHQVKITLKQTGKEGESKDGMDLALVVIDKEKSQIQYAGAYNPLFLIRNGELLETKADRNPIGIYIKELASFTNHVIDIQKGDTIYTFSDGFVDQFGGEKGSKFKTKNFKQLLLKIQDKTMTEQHDILYNEVDDWRGEFEQVDDIIIVGMRF